MPISAEIKYTSNTGNQILDNSAQILGMSSLDHRKPEATVLVFETTDQNGQYPTQHDPRIIIKAGPEKLITAEAAELKKAAGPGVPKYYDLGIVNYENEFGEAGELAAFSQEYIPIHKDTLLPLGRTPDQTWQFRSDWLHPNILIELGGIIGRIHDRGIIHLDLGGNTVLTNSGKPYVFDFNASLEVQRISMRETDYFSTIRSKMTFAPVEMQLKKSDPFKEITSETDLYALGIMTYALLTGLYLPHNFVDQQSAYHTENNSEPLMDAVKKLSPQSHWNRRSQQIKNSLDILFTQATSHFYTRSPKEKAGEKAPHFFTKLTEQIWNV